MGVCILLRYKRQKQSKCAIENLGSQHQQLWPPELLIRPHPAYGGVVGASTLLVGRKHAPGCVELSNQPLLRTPGGLSTLSLIRDNTVSLRGLLADTRGERGLFKLQMSPEASRKQSCKVISWVAWTFQQLIATNEMQWCLYVLMIFDV